MPMLVTIFVWKTSLSLISKESCGASLIRNGELLPLYFSKNHALGCLAPKNSIVPSIKKLLADFQPSPNPTSTTSNKLCVLVAFVIFTGLKKAASENPWHPNRRTISGWKITEIGCIDNP